MVDLWGLGKRLSPSLLLCEPKLGLVAESEVMEVITPCAPEPWRIRYVPQSLEMVLSSKSGILDVLEMT